MSERVWVRGRPVRGFIWGIVFGLGVALIAHAFKVAPFEDAMFTYFPLASGVLFGIRSWIGSAYRAGAAAEPPAPPAPAAPPVPPEEGSGA